MHALFDWYCYRHDAAVTHTVTQSSISLSYLWLTRGVLANFAGVAHASCQLEPLTYRAATSVSPQGIGHMSTSSVSARASGHGRCEVYEWSQAGNTYQLVVDEERRKSALPEVWQTDGADTAILLCKVCSHLHLCRPLCVATDSFVCADWPRERSQCPMAMVIC
jgi:hypothetical protein